MRGIVAIGAGGAAMLETLIHAAMSGSLREDLECVLTGVPDSDMERIDRLVRAYHEIHSLYAGKDHQGFAAFIHVSSWPENGMEMSLTELAETDSDQLVLQALYSREKTLRRDLGILESAGAAWTEQLDREPDGSLLKLLKSVLEGVLPVTVMGSLTEAVCSAGAGPLMKYLMSWDPRVKITGIFSGPLFLDDDAANCQSALNGMPDGLYSFYYYALPKDLRMPGSRCRSIADLVFLGCFFHALDGRSGEFTFASSTGVPDFGLLGGTADAAARAEAEFVRAGLITLLDFGPSATDYLNSSGLLDLSRNGWKAVCFGNVRKNAQDREREKAHMGTLMQLMQCHGEYLKEVTEHVPMYFLNQSGLSDALQKARAHYLRLLDLAGHKALMDYDAEKSGIGQEETVHRGSMEETEAEKGRRQLQEIGEKLETMEAEQAELNRGIGGRAAHAMLSAIAIERMEEAENLREQGREAAARIEQAAAIARPEEMPRVDAARSRLERMNRHYVLLEGKREQAEKDADQARNNAVRTTAPELELHGNRPDILFPRRVLEILSVAAGKEKRERRRLLSEANACWPEAGLEHCVADLNRLKSDGDTATGTARFLELLLTEAEGDWRK